MTSLILQVTARLLEPLMLFVALFLLFQGHDSPGGGFAGGLVAASAFALHSIAFDVASARRILIMDPIHIIGVGGVCALLAGFVPTFIGRPFLTALWGSIELPSGRTLEIGTPLLFDLGVFFAVLGATLTVLFILEEE